MKREIGEKRMIQRRGLGKTFGKGYYNIVPLDHHIHSLSAKGVSTVNITKYQGKWYDQASYPTWFDKDCKGQSAEYKLRPDGKIDVLNTCLKDTGNTQIKGTARSVSKNNKNLKVSFFPLIEGDYNILYLDKGYQNVIVGSKDKKYFWILTRSKKISQANFNKLKDIAKKKGYDISKLKVMTLNAKGKKVLPIDTFKKRLKKAHIKPFNLPVETAILVPSTQDGNKPINADEFNKRVNETRDELFKLFGGFTSVSAIGAVEDEHSKLPIKEPVNMVVAYAEQDKFKRRSGKFIKYVEAKKKEWGQQSMGVIIENDLLFI